MKRRAKRDENVLTRTSSHVVLCYSESGGGGGGGGGSSLDYWCVKNFL